jgi:hypothetical protein|tara:strand:+ start:283 stop:576 length:294 start_codon:yes stop_codon:yes gene_type:complete
MLTLQAFKNVNTWLLEGGFIELMAAESLSSPNTIAPIADATQAHEISIDELTSSVTPVREDRAGQAKAKAEITNRKAEQKFCIYPKYINLKKRFYGP